MGKTFDPGKYNMVSCPLCKGKGKYLQNPDGFEVCTRCAGFGLIEKGKETFGEEENKQ